MSFFVAIFFLVLVSGPKFNPNALTNSSKLVVKLPANTNKPLTEGSKTTLMVGNKTLNSDIES